MDFPFATDTFRPFRVSERTRWRTRSERTPHLPSAPAWVRSPAVLAETLHFPSSVRLLAFDRTLRTWFSVMPQAAAISAAVACG